MYYVYYTDASYKENDRVWLATGISPVRLTKIKEVVGVGPPGAWDAEKVGRPTVIWESGVFRMWYDGTAQGARHVGYAESVDGVTFTKSPRNPVFLNAGAVDVKRVGDVLVMLREGSCGTSWATSVDGLCWVDRGLLLAKSGQPYDAFGQVTPFLLVVNDQPQGVFFGGARVSTVDKNRIALAAPTGTAAPPAGCTACTVPGLTCAESCRSRGNYNLGVCAVPGSEEPGSCCDCSSDGCEECSRGQTCQESCAAAGWSMGTCGKPGSRDPADCCACN